MNGRERILAQMEGRPVDRLPLMPITMMYAGDTAGIRYGNYARHHERLVESQLKTADTFGFDYVSAISDPAREASDLGGVIEWFEDQPPAINETLALLAEKEAFAKLPPPDQVFGERMKDRVAAVRALRAAVGDEKVVEGWVEGPCALAADFRGLNRLMLDFTDDEAFVDSLFSYVIELEITFARRQREAGADVIGIGDAAASLVGPRIYNKFVLPYEKRLVEGIHATGARVRLHICGNTKRILQGMGTTGADLIDLDYLSPMADARAAMGPNQTLLGNLDPVRIVRDGSPDSIREALEQCWQAAGPRYIVGAGCEIPRGTPPANVHALREFAITHNR